MSSWTDEVAPAGRCLTRSVRDGGVQGLGPEYEPSVRRPRYGWGGGLGTLWCSWPDQRTPAVLLTQVLPASPELVAAFIDAVEKILHGG